MGENLKPPQIGSVARGNATGVSRAIKTVDPYDRKLIVPPIRTLAR
jgi:hypothetical protein